MDKTPDTHLFALYVPDLSALCKRCTVGTSFTVDERELVRRVVRVLRLHVGESLILFDRGQSADVSVQELSSKKVVLQIETLQRHAAAPEPIITLGLPILKRKDLEEAIYAATEVGVNEIQLLETAKSGRLRSETADLERLERIVVAACEQAKHFTMPTIHPPLALADWIASAPRDAATIFFDPTGEPLGDVTNQLRTQKPSAVRLLLGPEADLTAEEKELLRVNLVTFCALTPTVLQAHRAVAVACGAVRSLL